MQTNTDTNYFSDSTKKKNWEELHYENLFEINSNDYKRNVLECQQFEKTCGNHK